MRHTVLENLECFPDEETYIIILQIFSKNFMITFYHEYVKLMSYKIVDENIFLLLQGLPIYALFL